MLISLQYFSFPIYLILDLSSVRVFEFFSLCVFFDFFSVIYLFVLFVIVSSIHLFIKVYMGSDSNLIRFVYILNIFVISMIVLIVSPNLISLMLGWDGLGFSSFLLVAWFGCFSSRVSSLKTFLVNRLGDGLFLISLCFFFFQGHFFLNSLDYLIWVVYLVLIFSFFTKSAHFPFSSWLPDAMAAPTPVSALVHSSTLVTAGLYLIFRLSYLLSYSILEVVQYLGLWTLFIGSLGACLDQNSKKIVAYSTISQLGFMSFVLSLGCFDLCFFYMMVHALFKALLFISVGCFLVLKNHNQDVRHLNNCWGSGPLVAFSFFFSCFSLSGFPFFSGFYLKEVILGGVVFFQLNYFLVEVFFFSILLTVVYSFRLFFFIGLNWNNTHGVFNELGNTHLLVFLNLFLSIFGLGLVIFNSLNSWLNVGSSIGILMFSLVGLYLSNIFLSMSNSMEVLNIIGYVVYMFFLNIITMGFNKLYVVGHYLIMVADNGFFLFYFINRLSFFWNVNLTRILGKSFFLNWLGLFGLSLVFVLSISFW
uniref:NADH:ubiquinone reductase (H(+)-translocating) n=1 Tax=Bipalium adventitium TaxID=66751 RepID=A0A8K1XUE6_9PLAT|nr:NADH dehydrogenase subunit 5 [Bipalium adventitium]